MNRLEIEKKWQGVWREKKAFAAKDFAENKFYHLVMFPYSSGDLHLGHWYNFTGADVYARYKLMQGKNVLSPIGFDAFGLPAENAAIGRGIHPAEWTQENIAKMTEQLQSIGAIFDWSRVINTSKPEYYKWTQWIFLKLFEKGLAFRKKAPCNWCPKDQTVLANEQVIEGKCERCDTPVVQKEIEQWFFKITDYAERLLTNLDKLDWPEKTILMQKNWLGKSEGSLIRFRIQDLGFKSEEIEVFTTRSDTLFGATYLVLAPEHPLIHESKIMNHKSIKDYINQTRKKTELERLAETKEKTGVFTGIYAINPVNKEKIPIWISDYVLMGYGTGAIMAVPAHDQRDFEFAKKFNLPIKQVIGPKEKIPAKKQTFWRIRDWLVSRQRYWGAPIPIIYCKTHGVVAVPEKDLPVLLPEQVDFAPQGKSPLASNEKFINTNCPKCGRKAKRETDTLDTFVDSSWYFIRYLDPHNENELAEQKKIKYWLPVDIYIGGAEHSVLHLLYARFISKFLHDIGILPFEEPFPKLRHQGTILGSDGQKMSKSRGNVVNPDDYVKQYGADVVRSYLCFMGPYDQGGPWNPEGIKGIDRFFQKVERLVLAKGDDNGVNLDSKIKAISADIEKLHFNTALAKFMELINQTKNTDKETKEKIIKILLPFAPHLAEELWVKTGHKTLVSQEKWPEIKREIKVSQTTIVVQVNGKLRDKIVVSPDTPKDKIIEMAKTEKVKKWLEGKKLLKTIYVPLRLINFVVR